MKKIFLVVALILFSLSASADIYKWVDANGKVHYSNTPPPNVKGTKVKVDDPAPAQPGLCRRAARHAAGGAGSDHRRDRPADRRRRPRRRGASVVGGDQLPAGIDHRHCDRRQIG